MCARRNGARRQDFKAHFAVQVELSAAGQNGSLGALLPANQLRQVVTHEARVSHNYPYKFLRAALTGAGPTKSERTTKVDIDANGLLKVRFMMLSLDAWVHRWLAGSAGCIRMQCVLIQ